MNMEAWRGILLPLMGTSLGAACVFVMKKPLHAPARRAMTGFAAGVMAAATVWSLLLPAMAQSEGLGRLAFLPAAAGFWAGILFLLFLDRAFARFPANPGTAGAPALSKRTAMLALAVTLHNLPEGMAVGAVYAGLSRGGAGIAAAEALTLSLGIAVQNFPEGAIISMPLRAEGMGRGRAFAHGALSGVVEPVGALLTIGLSAWAAPALPCLLSFAAGAMTHVVVAELIPETSAGRRANPGALMFALGFTIMMSMDAALG